MSPGSNTESYSAFAHIRLRENPGKNLNQHCKPPTPNRSGEAMLQDLETEDGPRNSHYGQEITRKTEKKMDRPLQ
ncbi:hypothetical protein ANN_14745 [Periplaneta americana]|uniref:Uncharacterized protein n=1 Tax=Periplaneta americana TaxID=6978 RepID=A0ABQ8SX36_PERAM|nr:hypothetical protein ANN_14745 [Periplaneta americana]